MASMHDVAEKGVALYNGLCNDCITVEINGVMGLLIGLKQDTNLSDDDKIHVIAATITNEMILFGDNPVDMNDIVVGCLDFAETFVNFLKDHNLWDNKAMIEGYDMVTSWYLFECQLIKKTVST